MIIQLIVLIPCIYLQQTQRVHIISVTIYVWTKLICVQHQVLDLIFTNNNLYLLLKNNLTLLPFLFIDFNFNLLCAESLVVLGNFEDSSTMSSILFEFTLVMVLTIATSLSISTIWNQNTFSMPHIILPFTNISFFIVFIEVLTSAMSLILCPITYIKLFVKVKAFSFSTFSKIFFPVTNIFISSLSFSITTDISAISISQIGCINIAIIDISVSIVYFDWLS